VQKTNEKCDKTRNVTKADSLCRTAKDKEKQVEEPNKEISVRLLAMNQ